MMISMLENDHSENYVEMKRLTDELNKVLPIDAIPTNNEDYIAANVHDSEEGGANNIWISSEECLELSRIFAKLARLLVVQQ